MVSPSSIVTPRRAVCVCTVRPTQAPAHERVVSRPSPAGRPALRLSYGHGTHGSASCYVKHRDKRTWVLVQERLKVVPLAAYSPVAGGRRVKRHTRRPNGLELLVLCCCSRSRSRHERGVTSSAFAHSQGLLARAHKRTFAVVAKASAGGSRNERIMRDTRERKNNGQRVRYVRRMLMLMHMR